MAETRSRREPNGSRTPPRPPDEAPVEAAVESAPPPAEGADDNQPPGFDAEVNSRYEEIKRGGTYITQLQQMTMAQLLKAAKEENLPKEDYAGLKKQDLIFRIL